MQFLAAAILTVGCTNAATPPFVLAPDHLLKGQPTLVTISSSITEFDLASPASTYALSLQWANGSTALQPSGACSVVAKSNLRCTVTWVSPGTVVAMLKANGTLLHTSAMWIYTQPNVTNIAPSTLPLMGGSMVRLNFAAAVKSYSVTIMRIMNPLTLQYVDCPLKMDAHGLSASGRSSIMPGFTEATVGNVHLSFNGESFVDIGLTTTFVTKKKLKIGFIYLHDPTDFGWTFQHNVARLVMEKKFFGLIETVTQNHVGEWGPNMCDFCAEEPGWNASKKMGMWNDEPGDFFGVHESAMVMKKWIEEEEVKMVIGTSFYYQWDMFHLSKRWPGISFVEATGFMTRPNMAVVFPKVYQARYLSGIAVAWYIKKHNLPKRVGYVSSYQLGETTRAINAFKLGMEQVDPEIEVYLTWLMTWFDPRKERLGARRLLEFYGIEALAQHTDSQEPQIVMREYGKVGVGYNTDMLLTVGDSVLTSPVLIWSALYEPLIQKALDGEQMDGANLWTGLESGSWRLSEFSSKVPIEATIQITEEQNKLAQGIDTIFCKPGMKDNKGRTRNGPVNPAVNPVPWEADHLVPGTTCLSGSVINQNCQEYKDGSCAEHWLLAGVVDSCAPSPSKPNGVTSPKLTNGECFLGNMDIPDKCPDGEYLTLYGCTKVPAGSYSRNEEVSPCRKGYAAPINGSTACTPCSPGYAASNTGSVQCSPCRPGNFSSKAGAVECTPCFPGMITNTSGMSQCSRCKVGKYSSTLGRSNCSTCEAHLPGSTTRFMAAISTNECTCPQGYYDGGPLMNACVGCTEGLFCNEAGLTEPLQAAGYFVETKNVSGKPPEYSVHRCRDEEECPTGEIGSCAAGRVGVGCGNCLRDHFESMGSADCEQCGAVDLLPVLAIVTVTLFFLIELYMYATADVSKQHMTTKTAAIAFAQLAMAVQTLGVFHELDIQWVQPIQTVLSLLSFLNFELKVIKISCVTNVDDPLLNFMITLFIGPTLMAALATVARVQKLMGKPGLSIDRYFNAIGLLALDAFIAITMMVLRPFHCLESPNGFRSMASNPAVLCWESSEHSWLTVFGIIGILAYPATILGIVTQATWRYTSVMCSGQLGYFDRYRFLYTRFTAKAYYWGVCYLLRNFLVSLTPVIFMDSAIWQVVWVASVFVISLTATGCLLPWRSLASNGSELGTIIALVIFLQVGAFMVDTDETDGARVLGYFLMFVLVCAVLVVLGVSGLALLRRHFPNKYGAFLCYHKVGAASMARYFKIRMDMHSGDPIFLDSDHLEELDLIFDTVRSNCKNLVILQTKLVLTQPWCAGEIATANVNRVRMVPVAFYDYERPQETLLTGLDSLWSEQQKFVLVQYGIQIPMIEAAYRFLNAIDSIKYGRFAPMQEQEGIVEEVVARCQLPRNPLNRGLTDGSADEVAQVVIVGNTVDAEARCTCEVLRGMVQAKTKVPTKVVTSAQEAERHLASADYLIVVLTKGLLEDDSFAEVLLLFEQQREKEPIEIATVLADTNFSFPDISHRDTLPVSGRCTSYTTVANKKGAEMTTGYRRCMNILARPFSPQSSWGIMSTQVSEICKRFHLYTSVTYNGKRTYNVSAPKPTISSIAVEVLEQSRGNSMDVDAVLDKEDFTDV